MSTRCEIVVVVSSSIGVFGEKITVNYLWLGNETVSPRLVLCPRTGVVGNYKGNNPKIM